MPVYIYKHPQTNEIFEVIRRMSESDLPFFAPDGVECKKMITSCGGWKKNKEVFEADPGYVKKCNPKKIRYRDGHIEKYDPTKHC